ncbi:MAG: hypothetical protein K6U07_05945, partial [Firmicutes bacterium]|nr:hypothetical protein [Bacillota bacterium]
VAESFHPYAANTRYTWTISRPGAKKLKLHFAKLELGAGDMLGLTNAAGETLISFPEGTVKENEWTDWHFTDTIRITLLTDYRDFRYDTRLMRGFAPPFFPTLGRWKPVPEKAGAAWRWCETVSGTGGTCLP